MGDEPDELDDLLAPTPTPDTPGLRDALFQRTRRRLRLGRWVRRAGARAGAAAVFAAGLGLGRWYAPRERETVVVPVPVREVELVTVPVPVVVPVVAPVPDRPATEPPAAARTARALELDAEQADDAPAATALYRRAGDAYLTAEQDYVNAARCYRLSLARGGAPALAPQVDDSWLLTSLKNAAFKENIRATRARD